ncbi:MAG TPA: hypothetical protein VKM55_04115 [Candidatus Lokiarchaeia archaeon]|nr:hypothetical protein [Candidatus Lokiarchaeia archaeon]
MSRAIAMFLNRYHDTTIELDFDPIPCCPLCGRKMKVQARSKPHRVVGKEENYIIITVYRRCGNSFCPGSFERPIAPENPYVMIGYEFDYEVQALICEMRYKDHYTDKEISEHMQEERGIWIDETTVGDIVRLYEVACSQKCKPEIVEKVKKNGGIFLTVDAMEPLKGEPPIYMARDEFTDLKLGAEQLRNKKESNIERFIYDVKERIDTELGVNVIGIMSDAQKELVDALKTIFPDVPLSSCEYHFYQDVLKAPFEADSHVITTIRSMLRNLGDVKAYKAREPIIGSGNEETGLIDDVLEATSALSNWTKKPRDPAFSGLELRGRVEDLLSIIREMHVEIGSAIFTKHEEKVIVRLKKYLEKGITTTRRAAAGLERIKGYLERIKLILDADEESAEVGLERLRMLKEELVKNSIEMKYTKFEKLFIEELDKYIESKGERLFTHRLLKNAPRTNNKHELDHLKVKHLIRRTIGHAAASYYLLVHGAHLIFVNPEEKPERIKKILQEMDVGAAKEVIAAEKRKRNAMSIIMHVKDKWKEKLAGLRAKLFDLKRAKTNPS